MTEVDDKLKDQQWKDNLDRTLEDIRGTVNSIYERQVGTAWQWLFNLGVSAMAVGATWIIATTPITQGDYTSGLFVFVIGLLIALLSTFYRPRKKSNSSSNVSGYNRAK